MVSLLKEDMGYEVFQFKDCELTKKNLVDQILMVLNDLFEETPNCAAYHPSVTVIVYCGPGYTLPNGDNIAFVP